MGLIKFIKPTWFRTNFKGTGLRTDFKATGLRNDFKATGLRNDFKATGLRSRLQSEDGSISVLVFGLFVVVLLSGVVLTDISAILVAQRSLVQATESAAQSAAHALDLETYYEGKHSVLSFLVSDASPVIPIDCAGLLCITPDNKVEITITLRSQDGKRISTATARESVSPWV